MLNSRVRCAKFVTDWAKQYVVNLMVASWVFTLNCLRFFLIKTGNAITLANSFTNPFL